MKFNTRVMVLMFVFLLVLLLLPFVLALSDFVNGGVLAINSGDNEVVGWTFLESTGKFKKTLDIGSGVNTGEFAITVGRVGYPITEPQRVYIANEDGGSGTPDKIMVLRHDPAGETFVEEGHFTSGSESIRDMAVGNVLSIEGEEQLIVLK